MQRQDLRSSYLDLTPDPDIVDDLLAHASDEQVAALPRLGLAVIGPEAFGLGVAGNLAQRLAADGLRIVGMQARWLTEDDTAAMFVPGWLPERFRWWMIQRRWTSGHSAALLVSPDDTTEAGATLSANKGYRIPTEASPGTWRGDFPSINGVLDLLHTADSPAHVLRNAWPFFTSAQLCAAADAVTAGTALSPGQVADDLRAWEQPGQCRPFELVYLQLLHRLLAQADGTAAADLRADLSASARVIGADHCLRTEHSREPKPPARALAKVNDLTERSTGRLASPLIPAWGPQLRSVITRVAEYARTTPGTSAWLDPLTDLPGARHRQWDRIIAALQAERLVANDWDALILLTTLYYTDQELVHLLP